MLRCRHKRQFCHSSSSYMCAPFSRNAIELLNLEKRKRRRRRRMFYSLIGIFSPLPPCLKHERARARQSRQRKENRSSLSLCVALSPLFIGFHFSGFSLPFSLQRILYMEHAEMTARSLQQHTQRRQRFSYSYSLCHFPRKKREINWRKSLESFSMSSSSAELWPQVSPLIKNNGVKLNLHEPVSLAWRI